MWKQLSKLCLVLLCASTLGAVGMLLSRLDNLTVEMHRLNQNVERLSAQEQRMVPGQLYASWYSGSPPVLVEVTTTRGPFESVADWETRHDKDVKAARIAHPPV